MKRKTRSRKGDVIDQTWDSLTSLKKHFENTGQERVKEFDGYSLTTSKHVYTLYDGQLFRD